MTQNLALLKLLLSFLLMSIAYTYSSNPTMSEGTVAFNVAGLTDPCHTWYKVFGNLNTTTTPLIILHGGPGACHDYLLPLADLAPSRPIVFYDQIGNGRSTHLTSKAGDEEFWSVKLFKDELDNLLSHLHLREREVDVYGHSWGGMLAVEWAATPRSANLRRLVLSNSLASMDSWRTGISALRKQLPQDVQQILDHADETQMFETPEYQAAIDVFYKRHLSLSRPWPAKEVQQALDWFAKDPTTYWTMYVTSAKCPYSTIVRSADHISSRYGPSELYISGSLRNWTSIPFLKDIKAPTLLINGVEDEAQDIAMQPFFEHIDRVKWVTLDKAAHFSHVDQRVKYMKLMETFLDG
jgi:proline-specific peptidase